MADLGKLTEEEEWLIRRVRLKESVNRNTRTSVIFGLHSAGAILGSLKEEHIFDGGSTDIDYDKLAEWVRTKVSLSTSKINGDAITRATIEACIAYGRFIGEIREANTKTDQIYKSMPSSYWKQQEKDSD